MAEFVTVYLSSSFQDLKVHRDAVTKALNQLADVKVIAMEDYVARDDRPLAACLGDVTRSDIYVGLFAWRYGFVPAAAENPLGLSITELELKAAQDKGIPVLAFVLKADAAWPLQFVDTVSGENERGQRIEALRRKLLQSRLASEFGEPVALAGMVSNAVSNELRRLRPQPAAAAVNAAAHLQREVTHALYLAHHALDGEHAEALALELGAGLERGVRLSREALFASDAQAVATREDSLIACHAAATLITPQSLAALRADDARSVEAMHVLHARTGRAAMLLAGVAAADVPAHWPIEQRFDVATAAGRDDARLWLAARQPPPGCRSVGVPVCVVAMTGTDLASLESREELLAQLTGAEREQFTALTQALGTSGVSWRERYRDSRHRWRPFEPQGASVRAIAEEIGESVGRRGAIQQRRRHVRLQWYPFDPLVADNPRLRPVYRAVARAGCVVLVDELSLFHPGLREAFLNSPFFNNDQVAIVTISPVDPGRDSVEAMLESAARRRLAGAFDRYAVEYDPQCELAVGDERRLRRWLNVSLPATLARLQEPQPDRGSLSALAAELGESAFAPKREYGWGGGGRV